jgi:regulatory protein
MVPPRIERIEDAGPERKARRLVFDDGSDPRVTSAAALKLVEVSVGLEIEPASVDRALAEVEPALAKESAFRLLGYRDRSRAELGRKLHDRGYPAEVASAIVARLEELGIVDDQRFAASWVRSRVAQGMGARRIARELSQKGVAAETIDAALTPEASEETQLRAAVHALRGKVATEPRQRDRLVRRLVTKGFDLRTAIRAVDSSNEEPPR